jgi:hypothetical protein
MVNVFRLGHKGLSDGTWNYTVQKEGSFNVGWVDRGGARLILLSNV